MTRSSDSTSAAFAPTFVDDASASGSGLLFSCLLAPGVVCLFASLQRDVQERRRLASGCCLVAVVLRDLRSNAAQFPISAVLLEVVGALVAAVLATSAVVESLVAQGAVVDALGARA